LPDEAILKNKPDKQWKKMLPELGNDSSIFTILRVDLRTSATALMVEMR
jgi:hypothetical protein